MSLPDQGQRRLINLNGSHSIGSAPQDQALAEAKRTGFLQHLCGGLGFGTLEFPRRGETKKLDVIAKPYELRDHREEKKGHTFIAEDSFSDCSTTQGQRSSLEKKESKSRVQNRSRELQEEGPRHLFFIVCHFPAPEVNKRCHLLFDSDLSPKKFQRGEETDAGNAWRCVCFVWIGISLGPSQAASDCFRIPVCKASVLCQRSHVPEEFKGREATRLETLCFQTLIVAFSLNLYLEL